MNKLITVITILVIIIITIIGCSKNNEGEQTQLIDKTFSSEPQNPFKDKNDTVVLGSLGHRVPYPTLDKNGNPLPLEYNGGEFSFEYEVTAEGDAKNIGFMIFLDGIPQPFKIDDTDEQYRYIHNLKIDKDNEPIVYNFIFTPITGEKGDTLNLTVTSIYFPQFIPDMKETSSYGLYHSTLPVEIPIKFNSNTDKLDNTMYSTEQYLSNTQISTYPINNEFIKNELSSSLNEITMEDLNSEILTKVYYNDKKEMSNLLINKEGNLHITFKICGVPGAKYKNIFYINHNPISDDKLVCFDTTIKKGEVSVIDAEINVKELDDFSTFYIISVPINSKDYYNENVCLEKTPSILLYKDDLLSDEKLSNDKIQNKSYQDLTSNFDVSKIDGKIKNIYYGYDKNIILLSNKIYLYDLQNMNILSETNMQNLNVIDFRKIDNGYVAIVTVHEDGNNNSLDNRNYRCIFYDEELKQTDVINVSELNTNNKFISSDNITIAKDGEKVAFSTLEGLYIYDINKKKKTTLIDFTDEDNAKRLGLVNMRKISFADNGNKIAFMAESFDIPPIVGKSSFTTYGSINIDGTGLVNKQNSEYNAIRVVMYNSFMNLIEDSRTPTGKFMTMDLVTGKEITYNLTSKKESGNVQCSEFGNYFATSIINETMNQLSVRIYSRDNGKLIKEEIIEDVNPVYFKREPLIRIIDNSKICIVILGNTQQDNIDTKINTFNF